MEKKPNLIRGRLEAYFATGTEGICWSIFKDDPSGTLDPYDRLYPLDDGDDLIIFSDNKDDILWAGPINWEFKTNLVDQHPLGLYPGGKQAIDGYWVNGFPRSYNGDPKTWLSYFLEEYPAVCYKPSLNNGS